jgi:hypothetical protein
MVPPRFDRRSQTAVRVREANGTPTANMLQCRCRAAGAMAPLTVPWSLDSYRDRDLWHEESSAVLKLEAPSVKGALA